MDIPETYPEFLPRFAEALRRIDAANGEDPHLEPDAEGRPTPRELLYSRRLTGWLLRLEPAACEELRLAARAQHIRRWQIPRRQYPEGRAGYLKWRNDLKKFHAGQSGTILAECGYPAESVQRVQALNLKANLADPETQLLEDALCLVFLETQLAPLADAQEEATVVNALRKSWGKMSERARRHALALPLGPRETRLVQLALAPPAAS